MKRLHPKHWQDPVNAIFGGWLVLTPWALGFARDSMALSNSVIIGALLLAVALGASILPQAWEEWTEAGLGLWTAASPWVLGFSHIPAAALAVASTGAVVFVLAAWVLAIDKDYVTWGADRAA